MVDVAALLDTAKSIMWIILAIAIVGGGAYFYFWYSKFNKLVCIRDETSGGNLVREDKAREFTDDKNVLCWKLLKEKVVVACPPKEAVSIKGGKKYAELVRVQGDQYHWLNVSKFKEDAVAQADGQRMGKYFVISEDAKRQLADQIKKATEERTTKLNSLLANLIPFVGIGIVLIGGYFIYDSIGTHMEEMGDKFSTTIAQQAEISKQNALLLEQVNIALGEKYSNTTLSKNDIVVPNNKVPN